MIKFLDLGLQPLANSYLKKKNLNLKEKKFKLEIGFNQKKLSCIDSQYSSKRKNV